MNDRERLRALAHEVLRAEAGAVAVVRLCPRCGSDQHGAPHVRAASGLLPAVSLSYAGDLAVVAWGWDGPVGIDVERDGPLARPAEGSDDPTAWTRHEALAKATGLGLDATVLPFLPTIPLDLPDGYVGTLAGVNASWGLAR